MAATIVRNLCNVNCCINGIKHLQLSKPTVIKDVYRTAWYLSDKDSSAGSSTPSSSDSGGSTLAAAPPSKPRGPPNVFVLYLQRVDQDIKKSNPDMKRPQIIQEAAKRWKELDPETKAKMAVDRKKLYQKFIADRDHYNENATPEQIRLEEEEKNKKQTKKITKARKSLGMPKKPLSSYQVYMSENFVNRGDQPAQVMFAKIKDQWNAMSEKDRTVYHQKHLMFKAQYEKEMASWEESMIEEGNFKVIRKSTLKRLKRSEVEK